MKELINRLLDDIIQNHHPEFVILYGSIARGDFTDESDIDLAYFCDSPVASKDSRHFEGRKVDGWIYDLEEAVPTQKAFLRFVGGELLFDKHGHGQEFLSQVTDFYDQGPEPIQIDSINHLVDWCHHMLKRASGDSIESHFRRTQLPCELLEIYFALRNRWYLGSKQSFNWLKENDNATYNLFSRAFADPTNMVVIKDLVAATTESEQVLS